MFMSSFKGKIILPTVVILITLTVVLTSYISLEFFKYSNTLIDEKIASNTQSLEYYLRTGANHSKVAAMSMAHNLDAIAAIKARDRGKILEIFAPTNELYQIGFYTVTDEKGIVLARTHDPDRFGDSVLNQQNVLDALAGKVSTYFETGTVVKVSARTGVPVYDVAGTLVGVISAGLRYDTDDAVDLLKETFKSDVTVFWKNARISTTIRDKTGQRITGTALDPNVAKTVVDERTIYAGDADVFGVRYRSVYMPLVNANNEVTAVISVGYPLAELESRAYLLIRDIIIISAIGLAVSIVALYWVISTISKPILGLATEMNKMEDGNLTLVIDAKNNDEIGHAGKSLQKVANTLHKLIGNINVAISEHEKGNTEYRLDTGDFHGAYRLLVERIDKLSSRGMKDQLTGLPNRRSFDNRMKMEWHRAMRGQYSLGMLMLDVDEFKACNDTYGHQQGDIVLQTIAKVIPLPLKRGYDFAARYGGEEFIVLLPSVDLAGAAHVAEMIRTEIEKMEVPCLAGGPAKKVTISIGVCVLVPSSKISVEELIAHADAALYRAKETGRNRVCLYGDNG